MMGIERAVNFLRAYEFQGLTKGVTEAQAQVYKEPNETNQQMLKKAGKVAGYTAASIAAQCADPFLYMGVSGFRWMGFFNPLPPEPPKFPMPHDNAQFMDNAIERALFDWKPELQAEMREGLSDQLSEKWNIFQAVGEFCLAYSYENGVNSNYYKPTFLTVSEPLENGESYKSVGVDFSRLKQKEKALVLKAIYHQTEIGPVSAAGKKVYQDIRALASKMQQGNQGYLTAFKECMEKKEAAPAPTPAPALSSRVSAPPQSSLNVPTPASVYPSVAPRIQNQTFAPVYTQPAQTIHPSAPDLSPQWVDQTAEQTILRDLKFLKTAMNDGVQFLGAQEKKKFFDLIKEDTVPTIGTCRGNILPETSPKYCVARLSLLQFFKKAFKERGSEDAPDFFWIRELNSNNKSFHEIGQSFALLHERDYVKIQQTILFPLEVPKLDATLRKRLSELNEFAAMVGKNQQFLQMYEKFQLDLIAG